MPRKERIGPKKASGPKQDSARDLAVDRRVADVLPRRSGEPLFRAEWERRAFGAAIAMVEKGLVPFDDLRWRVTASITTWERANLGHEETFNFFERWLLAFERLLIDRGVISREELNERAAKRC
jgi:nitrile hydratase accessory protein